jgi:hypothetical protein
MSWASAGIPRLMRKIAAQRSSLRDMAALHHELVALVRVSG